MKFSMRAGLGNNKDLHALDKLSLYCERMGISIAVMQVNNSVVLEFGGTKQNLHELYSYLQEIHETQETL